MSDRDLSPHRPGNRNRVWDGGRFVFLPLMAWFTALTAILFVIYAPSFKGGFYLDSKPYIQQSHFFQGGTTLWEALRKATEPGYHPSSRRILPNVTVAMQSYQKGPDPAGLRIFNVSLHALNALILCFFLILLIDRLSPSLSDQAGVYAAMGTASLWALNPIHAFTVPYIAQRAVLMEAGFFILAASIFLHIFMRPGAKSSPRWHAGLILAVLAAALSKESAILFPVTLGLFYLYASRERRAAVNTFSPFILLSGAAAISLAAMLAARGLEGSLFSAYETRSYGALERCLTETRVVLHQLFLFLVPIPSQLSISPHYQISRGLLSPPSTALAVFCVLVIPALLVKLRKQYPIAGLALIWYFTGHLLESTVLPLEISFLHRNYLPTALLFLPVLTLVLEKPPGRQKWLVYTASIALVLVLATLSLFTYQKAFSWGNEVRFWTKAIESAPASTIAYLSLSGALLDQRRHEDALKIVDLGVARADLEDDLPRRRAGLYANRGLALSGLGRMDEAILWIRRALEISPTETALQYNLAILEKQKGRTDVARRILFSIIDSDPTYPDAHMQLALILLERGEPEQARSLLEAELGLYPRNATARKLLEGLYPGSPD